MRDSAHIDSFLSANGAQRRMRREAAQAAEGPRQDAEAPRLDSPRGYSEADSALREASTGVQSG